MKEACLERDWNNNDLLKLATPTSSLLLSVISFRANCSNNCIRKSKRIKFRKSFRNIFRLIILSLVLFISVKSPGQITTIDSAQKLLEIPVISDNITLDGILEERAWGLAAYDTTFWLHYPIDTGQAYATTEVRMMYDESNLYIGLICHESLGKPIVQSLKRDDDGSFNNSDFVAIVIDPADNSKNGYYFGVNAAGALMDGNIYQNGMYPSVNKYWNNEWSAEVSARGNDLIYEIVLPFSTLKYKNDCNNWGVNFIRNDVGRNVTYSWTSFPAGKHNYDLGYTGKLHFNEGLSEVEKKKVILIPSISSGINNNTETSEKVNYTAKAGLDAKVSLGTSLNLDLSINPDFSNVAVDKQYIDFYRFENYLPEQRGFFLENSDLITSFGTYDDVSTSPSESRVKPVYTRRIGINDDNIIPILYGVRLSGEITDGTRIGLINTHTEKRGDYSAQNYLVASVQRGIFKRSAIKGLFTNRNSIGDFEYQKEDYNRTGGIEFDFTSEDGKWSGSTKLHSNFTQSNKTDNLFYGLGFTYYNKVFKTQNWMEHVDKNYSPDIGFIPRLYHKDSFLDTTYRFGYTHFTNKYELYQFKNDEHIIVMGEYINLHTYLNEQNRLNELIFDLGYWCVFSNNVHIVLQGSYNSFDLLIPHDVLGNQNPVKSGTYTNKNLFFLYESDKRKKFKYKFQADYGEFYDGTKFTFSGGPTYSVQPFATITLNYNLADIELNQDNGNVTYHLISFEPEVSFSTKLFWSNLIQYNTQIKNVNFNSILQWRFAPMSDLYLIVKDDMTTSAKNKNFEFSFKLTYWLGL